MRRPRSSASADTPTPTTKISDDTDERPGKSSLMKVPLGLVRRDADTVLVRGEEAALDSPQEAAELGIGMVHQHFSLINGLTGWENVVLGDNGKVEQQAICADIAEVCAGLSQRGRGAVAFQQPGHGLMVRDSARARAPTRGGTG
jgi:ABC-type uncharacterized transport system ATPase subunit